MDFSELLISDPQEAIKRIKNQKENFDVKPSDVEKQYDVTKHDIFDTKKRPDKLIKRYRGEGKTGPLYDTDLQPVARIGIPYQKLIVERMIGLMLGNDIRLVPEYDDEKDDKQKELFNKVKKVWHDTKLNFVNREVLRRLLSEMEVAEYWYTTKNEDEFVEEEYKFKVMIFSPGLGDGLYPYFDDKGDLIAFCREYIIKDEDDKNITRIDVFTKEYTYWFVKGESGLELDDTLKENPKGNVLKKIPDVYYRQNVPEWSDTQTICDRQEILVSNFCDTNDYFSSPMVVVKGDVKGFADKGETGKIITLSGEGAEIRYLTWDNAPDAVKFEFENNEDLIFSGLQLPNISFSKMKALGYNQNAVIKLLFSDPHMKARTKWELFGIGIQRRINIISRMVAMLYGLEDAYKKMNIVPIMNPYLPENITETITALVSGAGGEKVMSQKRGVELNPLVENADKEIERIDEEAVKAMSGESYEL
jgi:SPP1 family phage portal protein